MSLDLLLLTFSELNSRDKVIKLATVHNQYSKNTKNHILTIKYIN